MIRGLGALPARHSSMFPIHATAAQCSASIWQCWYVKLHMQSSLSHWRGSAAGEPLVHEEVSSRGLLVAKAIAPDVPSPGFCRCHAWVLRMHIRDTLPATPV